MEDKKIRSIFNCSYEEALDNISKENIKIANSGQQSSKDNNFLKIKDKYTDLAIPHALSKTVTSKGNSSTAIQFKYKEISASPKIGDQDRFYESWYESNTVMQEEEIFDATRIALKKLIDEFKNCNSSGSTLTLVVAINDKVFCFNIGDSRSFLFFKKKDALNYEFINISWPQTPDHEVEKKRLNNQKCMWINSKGENRLRCETYNLGVSGALGDAALSKYFREPDFICYQINKDEIEEVYCGQASDGLDELELSELAKFFELYPPDEAILPVAQALFSRLTYDDVTFKLTPLNDVLSSKGKKIYFGFVADGHFQNTVVNGIREKFPIYFENTIKEKNSSIKKMPVYEIINYNKAAAEIEDETLETNINLILPNIENKNEISKAYAEFVNTLQKLFKSLKPVDWRNKACLEVIEIFSASKMIMYQINKENPQENETLMGDYLMKFDTNMKNINKYYFKKTPFTQMASLFCSARTHYRSLVEKNEKLKAVLCEQFNVKIFSLR